MATGGRKSHLQVVTEISASLGPASPASGYIGVVPAGALLMTAHLSVPTVFNSTTNTISLGTTPGGTDLLNGISLTASARTDTPVVIGSQYRAADTPIYFTLASTGAAPTAGQAIVAVDYIPFVG